MRFCISLYWAGRSTDDWRVFLCAFRFRSLPLQGRGCGFKKRPFFKNSEIEISSFSELRKSCDFVAIPGTSVPRSLISEKSVFTPKNLKAHSAFWGEWNSRARPHFYKIYIKRITILFCHTANKVGVCFYITMNFFD